MSIHRVVVQASPVGQADVVGIADHGDLAVDEHHRPVAVLADLLDRMGDEHDRLAFVVPARELAEAAVLEGAVADGERLVDEQDVRVGLDADGEGETGAHTRREVAKGHLTEARDAGELEHRLGPRLDPGPLDAEHDAAEGDVGARREVGVEADAELDHRSDASADVDRPRVDRVDVGEQADQRALAGAVGADDAEELALLDVEGDPVENRQGSLPAALDRPFELAKQARRLRRRRRKAFAEVTDLYRSPGSHQAGKG